MPRLNPIPITSVGGLISYTLRPGCPISDETQIDHRTRTDRTRLSSEAQFGPPDGGAWWQASASFPDSLVCASVAGIRRLDVPYRGHDGENPGFEAGRVDSRIVVRKPDREAD